MSDSAPPRWSLLERAMHRTVNNPDPMTARAWRAFVFRMTVLAGAALPWVLYRATR